MLTVLKNIAVYQDILHLSAASAAGFGETWFEPQETAITNEGASRAERSEGAPLEVRSAERQRTPLGQPTAYAVALPISSPFPPSRKLVFPPLHVPHFRGTAVLGADALYRTAISMQPAIIRIRGERAKGLPAFVSENTIRFNALNNGNRSGRMVYDWIPRMHHDLRPIR
jgi:hypothetical protein